MPSAYNKLGKRLPHTPTSRIKNYLRMMWLRSRERAAAIKRECGRCQECGKKQSKRKGAEVRIEVHHIDGIKWDEIIAYIRSNLLCNPSNLKILCEDCHRNKHKEEGCEK